MCTPEVTIPALPLEFRKLIDYTFLDTLKLYFIKKDIFYLFFNNFILIYDISYLDPLPSQCPSLTFMVPALYSVNPGSPMSAFYCTVD